MGDDCDHLRKMIPCDDPTVEVVKSGRLIAVEALP